MFAGRRAGGGWPGVLGLGVWAKQGALAPQRPGAEGAGCVLPQVGTFVAAACFVALLIKWCVINRGFPV